MKVFHSNFINIIRTQLYKTSLPKRAVALVAPGLNVKPSAMIELIKILNSAGSHACLISFSELDGQEKNLARWEGDFMEGYKLARSIAETENLPLVFLGYSLGALLGQYLLSTQPKNIQFRKQVLLAPATAIRLPRIIKSFINILGNELKIPSFTPKGYRINNWLHAKVYKTMIRWERRILKNNFSGLNIPTLLIIDPKDELISYSTIKKQIHKYSLTNHQCILLESDLKHRSTKYHHLMIDEESMGKKNWAEVTKRIIEFLRT